MDFETVNQGVPIIKGTQPYYPLPFQWSVHKWDSIGKKIKLNDGESFLDFKDQDIERKFVENLFRNGKNIFRKTLEEKSENFRKSSL